MSCIVEIEKIVLQSHDSHQIVNTIPSILKQNDENQNISSPDHNKNNTYYDQCAALPTVPEPENHMIRKELQFSQELKDKYVSPVEAKIIQISKCYNKNESEKDKIQPVEEEESARLTSSEFKYISKSVEDDFNKMINYDKSSNVVQKYLVFREINVNAQKIHQTSKNIRKVNNLEGINFSRRNVLQFTSKKVMLQQIIESVDYTEVASHEEYKQTILASDYYAAIEKIGQVFENILKWNIFLLICQHLIIQAAFVIGIIKYNQYGKREEDGVFELKELLIYLFVALSLLTEVFLIKRSKQFIEYEGNDYFFIIAALVQALSGIIAVSFAIENAPASISTAAYLLFLLSYLAYILFLTIRIIPNFEFLKETLTHFLYTQPSS